jgi:hypothetical protein
MDAFAARIADLFDPAYPAECARLSDNAVRAAEMKLGVRLPQSLIALLRVQNGGTLRHAYCAFPTQDARTWASDHAPFEECAGIAEESVLVDSAYYNEEWGQPSELVLLSGDGHWWIALDYRACGPHGEPSVVYYDNEWTPLSTSLKWMTLGYDFSTQLRGVRQISPGNVVKPTGSETSGGAWPDASASAWARPSSQYDPGRRGPGACQPVQRDVVEDVVPGGIARGLFVDKRAGDLVVAVRVVVEQPGRAALQPALRQPPRGFEEDAHRLAAWPGAGRTRRTQRPRRVPVRVEYSLTTLGWAATALLMTLVEWANEHLAEVEQARPRYRQTAARDPIGRADLDGLQAA